MKNGGVNLPSCEKQVYTKLSRKTIRVGPYRLMENLTLEKGALPKNTGIR